MDETTLRILTVGWEPWYVEYFAVPIARLTGFHFTHAQVGDSRRLPEVRAAFPGHDFVSLSKANNEPLPAADYELLASLETMGVPTIRTMVQGDRVLRERSEAESLGYATLLARHLEAVFRELQPDVVIGTFDSVHASLSLAVAKKLRIPWVTLAYPVIPDDLSGFCVGMTPDTLLPIGRRDRDALRQRAADIMRTVRSNRQQVFAYRPPVSFMQRARQAVEYARNFSKRAFRSRALGYDRFTWPSTAERIHDIVRRSINTLRMPKHLLIGAPPKDRFAYFPLHMAPESSVDTWAPFYQNQLALIAQISLALPVNMDFVVKLHFGDPDNYSRQQLLQLLKLPRLRIARPDASSHAFLKDAALVFGIQGTACLEAALLGKPVVIFGHSPYAHFPRTERARLPDELPEQIRRLLSLPPPQDDEVETAYAAYMARYMPGRINNWVRAIEPDELERLCGCFRSLKSHLEVSENRVSWYASPYFERRPIDSSPREIRQSGTR
jgi:hypothetical protein